MGLLDVLNGMQNGPRGPSAELAIQQRRHVADDHGDPRPARLEGVQAFDGSQPGAAPQPAPTRAAAGECACRRRSRRRAGGGGLGDVLKGGLGGLLAGGAAGSVLSGGLGDLLNQLQQSGHGETANTWVGKGENKPIAPAISPMRSAPTRSRACPPKAACRVTSCSRGLSQYLPQVVDHLTPDGRLPTENELSGRI